MGGFDLAGAVGVAVCAFEASPAWETSSEAPQAQHYMEARRGQEVDESAAWTVLFILSIVSVAVPAGLFLIISALYTPRLKPTLQSICDSMVRSFTALQSLCVLAYALPGWTQDSYHYLRAAENWVWLDYFDYFIDREVEAPHTYSLPTDLISLNDSHWSGFYLRNVFTSVSFLLLALLFSTFSVLFAKKQPQIGKYFPFFHPELFPKVLQLAHFRLTFALLLEIRLIQEGKDYDWCFILSLAVSLLALFLVPLSELLYLRLKQRGNLESEGNVWLFGATYREYRNCGQVFHWHSAFVEHFSLSLAICVLSQWTDIAPYVIFFTFLLAFLHIAVVRPYKHTLVNLEEGISLLIRLFIAILLVIVYNDSRFELDSDLQSLFCFILLLVWLLFRVFCSLYQVLTVVKLLRSLMSAPEELPIKAQSSEKSIGSILKTSTSEDLQISKRRIMKTDADLSAQEDATARSDLMDSPPRDTKEDLDPRLDRKTAGRRRRKKKVTIPT